jgi:hypothetical protein
MTSLQHLFDYFVKTKPSRGKLKAATTMLIHTCRALRINTPEEITRDKYTQITEALDEHFSAEPHKAIQDKSILAEMIGRFGPRDGWETLFDQLIDDADENLRQFTLHALEFSAEVNFDYVLPYIERMRVSKDSVMRQVAAHITGNLLCSRKSDVMKSCMQRWQETSDRAFITEVFRDLERDYSRNAIRKNSKETKELIAWLKAEFKLFNG